ncbi:response regulator transcription factor [Nesterenkonia natronophila]|uniref:DNA-binding response regulator n=1 Tax=Nesterenkonia natronophila TaxID=2174932 RepID=A0A3A4G2L6_9MICC|nr:response regulator transcription factor [Nesterenkonia natronophila]RJN32419.1 DNA-binding response regulator [Nesterenkonia natronophila]
MSETIKVMLVDDQHLLRMGFKLILEGEDDLQVVAEAGNGYEALDTLIALGEDLPDVVLMDVRMPRMDGIEATERIVERFSAVKVIILTTFDLDEYAFSGLQAGASAFLLKDVEPEDLVDAVRVVASGDAVVAPRVTRRLLEMYVRQSQSPAPAAPKHNTVLIPGLPPTNRGPTEFPVSRHPGAPLGAHLSHGARERTPNGQQIAAALDDGVVREPLTAREAEMLFAVAEGLSNAEIAERFFLSEATVKTHVRRILTKLQLRDRVQAVVYVHQSGLLG